MSNDQTTITGSRMNCMGYISLGGYYVDLDGIDKICEYQNPERPELKTETLSKRANCGMFTEYTIDELMAFKHINKKATIYDKETDKYISYASWKAKQPIPEPTPAPIPELKPVLAPAPESESDEVKLLKQENESLRKIIVTMNEHITMMSKRVDALEKNYE